MLSRYATHRPAHRHAAPRRLRPASLVTSSLAALAVVVGAAVGAAAPASAAGVTAVDGSAYGVYVKLSLFNQDQTPYGPQPQVQLSSDAANSPQDASADSEDAVYGPAHVVTTGPVAVHTEGSLGSGGSVSSSADVKGDPDPNNRPAPLLYDEIKASCSADASGQTSAVTFTNAEVQSQEGYPNDPTITTTEVPEGCATDL